MIRKPLRPPVVTIGNFIFMILYKLANAFENKQHKVKKKKPNKTLFTCISAAFRRSIVRRGVELCSTDMPSKIAQANNRRPQ